MPAFLNRLLHNWGPYLLLALAGMTAFLPVTSMTFALKNDIIALEYPINYFISQCLHNGVSPLWFNTWAMGFPLESVLTWSIYSPVQFLFNTLFSYSLYTLHIEFVFFIILAGCTMFSFLQKHVAVNRHLGLLLSGCYMLSGFMVGSSQWLLYITAASFLPLLLSRFLSLLKKTGWRNAFFFSAALYLHITSVYVAFTIIVCYILLCITTLFFWKKYRSQKKQELKRTTVFLAASGILLLILSLPLLYSSLELIQHINRGQPISTGSEFFNSNFLHPKGLQTLALPLPVVKMPFRNTEGSMITTYMGLFPLLLLPFCCVKSWREKNKTAFFLLFVAFIFLAISLGHLTPLRGWLNVLPGFTYFRNPGLFRLYFIFFLLLFVYYALSRGSSVISTKGIAREPFLITAGLLMVVLAFAVILTSSSFSIAAGNSLKAIIQTLTYNNAVFINALLQLFLLVLLLLAWLKKNTAWLTVFVFADLILNTLICTPYFSVSSYSVKEVDNLLQSEPGFPVQKILPADVKTTHYLGQAVWPNVNVYRKQVSLNQSYWGPLVLNNFTASDSTNPLVKEPLLSSPDASITIVVNKQLPDHIVATIASTGPTRIYILQNHYPGWKAFFNGKEIAVTPAESFGMKVSVPASGTIEFIYKKKWLLYVAISINVLLILAFLMNVVGKLKLLWRP